VAGHELAVVRVGAELYCIDAICTHASGYLDEGVVDGYEIECPLHGGRFDVRTGKPTQEPAELPIGTYPLRAEEGVVYVRVDQ
jgi:naphthalene 1,2-dioxygenase system ferredoxin subunit